MNYKKNLSTSSTNSLINNKQSIISLKLHPDIFGKIKFILRSVFQNWGYDTKKGFDSENYSNVKLLLPVIKKPVNEKEKSDIFRQLMPSSSTWKDYFTEKELMEVEGNCTIISEQQNEEELKQGSDSEIENTAEEAHKYFPTKRRLLPLNRKINAYKDFMVKQDLNKSEIITSQLDLSSSKTTLSIYQAPPLLSSNYEKPPNIRISVPSHVERGNYHTSLKRMPEPLRNPDNRTLKISFRLERNTLNVRGNSTRPIHHLEPLSSLPASVNREACQSLLERIKEKFSNRRKSSGISFNPKHYLNQTNLIHPEEDFSQALSIRTSRSPIKKIPLKEILRILQDYPRKAENYCTCLQSSPLQQFYRKT